VDKEKTYFWENRNCLLEGKGTACLRAGIDYWEGKLTAFGRTGSDCSKGERDCLLESWN